MVGTRKVINFRWEKFKRNIIKHFTSIKESIYSAISDTGSKPNSKGKKDSYKNGKAKNK